MRVRVQPSTTLRFHRAEVRLHATANAGLPGRGHAVCPASLQVHAQDVLEKELDHKIEEHSLRDRVPGDAAQHLLHGRHLGGLLLQHAPGV